MISELTKSAMKQLAMCAALLPAMVFAQDSELQKCADAGDATCQFKLGEFYDDGEGVPQSYSKAVNWYLKAAEQGLAVAQFQLYIMYYWGLGVCGDRADVDEWDRLAGEEGHPNTVSSEEAQERPTEPMPNACADHAEAVKWLRRAAEQSHVSAMAALGDEYRTGQYLIQDCSNAIKWYRLAAEKGHRGAQHTLAFMRASKECDGYE